MSEDAEVLFEQRGFVGLITLNRPKALNALTHGMALAMTAQLKAWRDDDSIGCVVVRGAGEKAFCAGGDIRALYESGKAGTSYALDFYRDEYILNALIKHYPKPYIALINGVVMGGGVGVSVHGSHRIASEIITFAMPETGIGLFPDVGGTYFLPRMKGEIGMYLALTGARLKTADAIYAGFATDCVPMARWDDLIAQLSKTPDPQLVLAGLAEPAPAPPLAAIADTVQRLFSGNSIDAILAALDADASPFARDALAVIATKSPTSLKVAYRQLREGAKMGFDDCMKLEYRLVHRVVAGHDFYEGVRATIIDKDGAPKWKPASLADVSDADIDDYFAPLENELELSK